VGGGTWGPELSELVGPGVVGLASSVGNSDGHLVSSLLVLIAVDVY
jgi:hypothetical protein